MFITAVKNFKLLLSLVLLSTLGIFCYVVFYSARAENGDQTMHIFPDSISTNGWRNLKGALAQDLYEDAGISEFTNENSAYITPNIPSEPASPASLPSVNGTSTSVVPVSSSEIQAESAVAPVGEESILPEPDVSSSAAILESSPAPQDSSHEESSPMTLPTPEQNSPPVDTPVLSPDPSSMPASTEPLQAPSPSPETTSPDLPPPPLPSSDAPAPSAELLYNQDESPAYLNSVTRRHRESESFFGKIVNSVFVFFGVDSAIAEETSVLPQTDNLSQPAVIEFKGFGVADPFKSFQIKNAQLRFSLGIFKDKIRQITASSPEGGDPGRLLIEAFYGNTWNLEGEIDLKNSLSNQTNGGYFLYALPIFSSWDDLSKLKIRFFYVPPVSAAASLDQFFGLCTLESDGLCTSMFLDAAWLEVSYAPKAEDQSASAADSPSSQFSDDTQGSFLEQIKSIFSLLPAVPATEENSSISANSKWTELFEEVKNIFNFNLQDWIEREQPAEFGTIIHRNGEAPVNLTKKAALEVIKTDEEKLIEPEEANPEPQHPEDVLELSNKEKIVFTHTDDNTDENLIIKTDKSGYDGLASSKVFFSVMNTGPGSEVFNLQAHFPADKGEIVSLKKLSRTPSDVTVPDYGVMGYFCEEGWHDASSTPDLLASQCDSTQEVRFCDGFNEDKTNCLVNGVKVGTHKKIEYKNAWKDVPLSDGEIPDNRNFFSKLLGLGIKRKPVPDSYHAQKRNSDAGYAISPEETLYFEMDIKFPVGSKGEFFIEAIGDSKGYGMLDPWWSSNWQYRMPITVSNTGSTTLTEYQVYVQATSSFTDFWSHVRSDGGDVRFLASDSETELNYWLQYFDNSTSSAAFWVQIDSLPAATTSTIYMYYGNGTASTTSNDINTFSYSTTTPIFYVVSSNTTGNMVNVSSFSDGNIVQLDSQAAQNVDAQGSVSFSSASSTSYLSVLKPVSAQLTGNGNDILAPVSFAGHQFIVATVRNTDAFDIISPFGTSTVQIWDAGTLNNTNTIGPGGIWSITSNITILGIIETSATSAPVLVFHRSTNNPPRDGYIVPPASTDDLYGIYSSNYYIGIGTSSTNVNEYASNNTTGSQVNQARGTRITGAVGATGNDGTGSAVRVSSNVSVSSPIGAVSQADSDGNETAAFWPKRELSARYLFTAATQYAAIACAATTTQPLSVYDTSGALVTTGTCASTGVLPTFPAKACLGDCTAGDTTQFNTGYLLSSATGTPFYAYNDDRDTDAAGDETNMIGPVQNRKFSWPPPTLSLGSEQVVSGPLYNQFAFRWYANKNAITPTDPWPSGANDLNENDSIPSPFTPGPGGVLRLRIGLKVTNATSTAGSEKFKLQYAEGETCGPSLTWTDVGAIGSSAVWRGYNNTSVSDGATLPSTLLSGSNVLETYQEANNSASTSNEIGINQQGEWDWVIQDNTATATTQYCFRMVKQDGTKLDQDEQYPQLLTNDVADTPTQSKLFDNEKSGTTTPSFEFFGTDTESDGLDYEIQIDDDAQFGSPNIDEDTVNNSARFTNIVLTTDKPPFIAGNTIRYTPTTQLVNGTTYWWRVRAKDTNGSNQWSSWSSHRSFTVDTTVTVSTWFQTTAEQFSTDTLLGTATATGEVLLATGSTTGTTTASSISFSSVTAGNAWGQIQWNTTEVTSDIKFHLEYYNTASSTWDLIPDSALSGNNTGFDASGVNLLALDTDTYSQIRFRANFTDSGATPHLFDWTLAAGNRVGKPTLTKLFDNEATGTTTPSFEFSSTDPEGDDLVYQFQWSTDRFFTSSTTRISDTNPGFQNVASTTDTSPFISGNTVRFTVQAADVLTASTTYWWRVRAKDPSGSNTYSPWSDTRSLTVDLSVSASTWYQTMSQQFDSDTLFGTQSQTSTNTVTVATTTAEVLVGYGEGSVQTPRFRTWNGSIWSAESSAQSVGSAIMWVVTKNHPRGTEYILGTQGSGGAIKAQTYSQGSWGNLQALTSTLSNVNDRGFDIAYEQNSGRAIAVTCDGDSEPSYWIWNGTSWTGPNTISITSTNACNWIKLASKPSSDEIIMVERDTGARYEAQVWNGSAWGNSLQLGSMTETTHEGIAVEYEASGNQGIVVVSNANTNGFTWTAWNGVAWSVAAAVGLGDDFEWGSLKRATTTDSMVLCYIDHDNDIGVRQWDGSAWGGFTEMTQTGNSKQGRPVDCEFENTVGRNNGFIMVPYSTTVNGAFRYWSATSSIYVGQNPISTILDSATVEARRAGDGKILALFYDDIQRRYDFSYWNGSAWQSFQTLEDTPSVSGSSPFPEPFMMAPKNPGTAGALISSAIDFDDGTGPFWQSVSWHDSQPGSSNVTYQVQYYNTASSSWGLIPDADLPYNSAGTSTGPINIRSLNTTTYNQIRLVSNLTCQSVSICPSVQDWKVTWSLGNTISGTIQQYDETASTTSGTVAVAVNGTLQIGKTGSIAANGTWSIQNVTTHAGDIITVFVSGAADANEAVGVTKHASSADITGMNLYELHLSIGSDDNQTLTNADISQYDNSVSGNEDIFYDTNPSNALTVCALSGCFNSKFWVRASTTYQFGGNLLTRHLTNRGTIIADGTTLYVSGSWINSSRFGQGTSTVIFTATSTTETIDSTGAASSTFNNVNFGETSGSAVWDLSSQFDVGGSVLIDYGRLFANASAINVAGNFVINTNGLFTKGSSTTTFNGASTATWTDNTASKQDLGKVLVDGTAKTVQFGSDVIATDITIGSDDTLDASAANNGITVNGQWTNNNVFTARSGTTTFAATSTGKMITPGSSAFYNIIFSGVGGGWTFNGVNSTSSNNFTVSTGTVTLPSGILSVGGSFQNTGGTFNNSNGTVKLTSTASGKTVRANGSNFYNLLFNGSGGTWAMSDTNATSTNDLTITAGTVTFPSGTLAIGNSFTNNGSFTSSDGTVRMFATSPQKTFRPGSSSLGSVIFDGVGGGWNIATNTDMTATGDFTINNGIATSSTITVNVGGSWLVQSGARFVHQSGTVRFNGTQTGKTISTATSTFNILTIDGPTGGWSIISNATTTSNFNLTNASSFTVSSGATVEVDGTFTNAVGGASTTWTGSTLYLSSSGANYTINTKTIGGDQYATLKLGATTSIRMWNSSALAYDIGSTASLYSQNHSQANGSLYIWGNYSKTSGTDYWSWQTDFDGASLVGSERQVDVRFAQNATATYSGDSNLHMVGMGTASTTLDNQGSGNYGITVAGLGTSINAQYFTVRSMNAVGLSLDASTTVTNLSPADFELAVTGGTMLTVSSSTIGTNPARLFTEVRFATSSGVTSGFNVTETGTAASYWWFTSAHGNYFGEAYDSDPGGDPGYIRWDDSNVVISVSGYVYSGEGGSVIGNPPCDGLTIAVRVKVNGSGDYTSFCDEGTGAYTVPGVTFSGDVVLTTYLDTDGGKKAVTITKTPTADITDMDLYQDRVIVRHEGSNAMTIADMAVYDNDQDPDIAFNAATGSPNTLSVDANTELHIWAGKTFNPGGNVTLDPGGAANDWAGSLHIDDNASFIAIGNQTHSVGGNWNVDTGANFTSGNSSAVFIATGAGKRINNGTSTFYAATFSGSGGGWAFGASTTIRNDLTISAGTLSGTNTVAVLGGNITGNGTISMTGGTVNLQGTGNFGGTSPWTFFNLDLGDAVTNATTTKSEAATTTVSGVLTIKTKHVLNAGSPSIWNMSGGGTPFVLNGTFLAQSSLFEYTATSSTNITAATYYQLLLAPSAADSPTYTLQGGTIATNDYFYAGDGTNGVTVTANTNDPTLDISGDLAIRSGAIFTASDSGGFSVAGNWLNGGTFNHSNGTLVFDAATTGKTINAGASPFYTVDFNNPLGGWTIISNATTSNNLSLTNLELFTLNSGIVLEVDGQFSNLAGGASTTWTGSTLYLNKSGGNYSINTKIAGADQYATLKVGSTTQARMWNSSSLTYDIDAAGSLYSQNHNTANGSLYIWGIYSKTTGTDYWSWQTDFDGASLAGSERQVDVRVATGSVITYNGGTLQMLGTTTATTTIDNQGSSTYSITVKGASTLTAQYYKIRNIDSTGLNFSGSPTVTNLDDGDFLLQINGGSMITIASTSIDANPLLNIRRSRFATSSGISTGFNVTETGSPASNWRFRNHYGNFAGEAYDSDPGGDPGYIIWDDSATDITVSGRVYSDEGSTPVGSPTCDDATPVVVLKVSGAGSYSSSCNSSTGAYSIPGVFFSAGDTITVYLDTGGGPRAANVTVDPVTNIANMDLYQNRVIFRNEQGNAMTIASSSVYDFDQDPDIPFNSVIGAPNTLAVATNTGLIIWTGKAFTPSGNVTLDGGGADGNFWNGTLHLQTSSVFVAVGNQVHTVAGNITLDSGATFTPGNSTTTMTATTTGKTITMASSTFYNLSFTGGGGWTFQDENATSSNDLVISAGAVIFPVGILSVGGSFQNTGGTFNNSNGTVKLTSTASGKTVRANGSNFYNLLFNGSGGTWAMSDTNATSTNDLTITAGTVTFPSGTLAIGNSFTNNGSFTSSDGTVRMFATSPQKTFRPGSSSLGSVIFDGVGGGWNIATNTDMTATGDFTINNGIATSSTITVNVGGSWLVQSGARFVHQSGTVRFNGTQTGKTISTATSTFNILTIDGPTGGWSIISNATTTSNFNLTNASSFTVSSGATVEVDGTFTNAVGGASTTWTGSTLYLSSSGANYTINTKTIGGDQYATLKLGATTSIRMWNSSALAYDIGSTASLYSQNHSQANGSLYIWGNYSKTSGTDYWSWQTDFDGASLVGSERQVDVRFAQNATATYSGDSNLHMVGMGTASTTLDNQGSGTYALTLSGTSTINAQYYSVRNVNSSGLNLSGTITVTELSNGDFQLAVLDGTMMTVSSSTIDTNPGKIFSGNRFATSSGVSSGFNVTRSGTSTNAWTFTQHYGNFAGEAFDVDPSDACGLIRWDDSVCLLVEQAHYRWRNDDGEEGFPSSEWYNINWPRRQPVSILNNGTTTLTNQQVKLIIPYDSDMQTDFDDLRFTDSSGTSTISYWLESYIASASSTVWVKVPTLAASASTTIYMYYGNSTTTSTSDSTSTFIFFDDFEDGGISEYSGDASLFHVGTGFAKHGSKGLDAQGSESSQTTNGIMRNDYPVAQGQTIEFFQYIDASGGANDEPCTLFGVQSPITSHQNYAVCLDLFPTDRVGIMKNVSSNDGSGATLATTSVSYGTGWYDVIIDWKTGNNIFVTVYDPDGQLFATTTATDSTYTSGGIGFSYWFQYGGWDYYSVRKYATSTPTYAFSSEETDSGASWKATEDTPLNGQALSQNIRLRFTIKNTGATISNKQFRLEVADQGEALNCESVASSSYADVPTTTAGCGTSPACMTTSAQFTDLAPTTRQLSVPSGMTYTQGQIMQDPSNETGAVTVPQNDFTEVEYNFQLTPNATVPKYCFRTSDSGSAIDSYTKVAQLLLSFPPTFGTIRLNGNQDIALIEGTTTSIVASGTVTDLNGYGDMTYATSTIFRSGVGEVCTSDSNNCYPIASPNCVFSSCSGNSCTITCTANIQYFAEPTDIGSAYESQNWGSSVTVYDSTNAHTNATSSNVEMLTLLALGATQDISYGTLNVGTDTGAANATSTITNTGNAPADIDLSGTNMAAGANTIAATNQKYATSTFTYSACSICSSLSTTLSFFDLNLSKPTTTATTTTAKNIFWGLFVPVSTAATTFQGTNTFIAVTNQ